MLTEALGKCMERSLSESAVRARAKVRGYRVEKSRQQQHWNNRGLYQLVCSWTNTVKMGVSYDATLAEIDWFLSEASDEVRMR